ncbi:hypothetical protein BURPS1655_K0569 [Burkholderia pseudomallei 1655]|nr:hypothetical protein BURPS1655_K0569 [Burkholderia pseudomallei 1655]
MVTSIRAGYRSNKLLTIWMFPSLPYTAPSLFSFAVRTS